MAGVFSAENRRTFKIRLLAMFLTALLFTGAAGIPIYAASAAVPADTADISGSSEESSGESSAAADDSADDSMPPLEVSSNSVLAAATGRGMILYDNSSDKTLNISAASKLMTAVIALESLSPDTQVTISKEAEMLDVKSDSPLSLTKGEKCSVKYLVTAIIYKDSEAAALSLAEYISNDEPSFVRQMNDMAKALNMNNTLFANTSGKSVLGGIPSLEDSPYNTYALQYTTMKDLSSLFRYALNLKDFKDIFTKYRSPLLFLSDGSAMRITSNMVSAWGITNLTGAASFAAGDASASSCVLAVASADDFEIAVILEGSDADATYQDLNKAIDSIFNYYEASDFVVAGETYKDVTLNGISKPVAAVFKTTVRYVHPAGKDYVLSDTEFTPSQTVTLPISAGELLGQVSFTLEDGTQIVTEVVAAEDVWSQSTVYSKAMELIQANINLFVVIAIAVCLFILSTVWTVSKYAARIFKAHAKLK